MLEKESSDTQDSFSTVSFCMKVDKKRVHP